MTPAEINALAARVRDYVHDLETRCDPAGDVQAMAQQRDENAALRIALAERVAAACDLVAACERVGCPGGILPELRRLGLLCGRPWYEDVPVDLAVGTR